MPATLSDAAQKWYFKLSAGSIDSLDRFVQDFNKHFYASRIHHTKAILLVDILQKDGESLKAYIQRFMQVTSRAKVVGDEGKMMAIMAGVRCQTPFWKSLRKSGVKTAQEFLNKADK